MISELTKSINSILYERVTSPLYGALFFSWSVWNWKIIYLTIFVSAESIKETKIDYISNNYSDIHFLLTYPVISTLLLLTVVPFLTNAAYWAHIKFHKWKTDKKHEVEMKQLLTIEQSIQIRSEIAEQEKEFDNLLSRKNSEIEQLKLQIATFENTKQPDNGKDDSNVITNNYYTDEQIDKTAQTILNNWELEEALEKLSEQILNGYPLKNTVNSQSLAFFTSNNLIKNLGESFYEFTPFGNEIHKVVLNKKFKP